MAGELVGLLLVICCRYTGTGWKRDVDVQNKTQKSTMTVI